jgi:DNA-binding NarL/FixJ family response regulator
VQRLIVTEGTAKAHVHSLLGKLGALSRTHAVARAQAPGLLRTEARA